MNAGDQLCQAMFDGPLADSAVYWIKMSGTTKSLPVVPYVRPIDAELVGENLGIRRYGFDIRVSDIAKPRRGDTIRFRGETWTVSGRAEPNEWGDIWRVEVDQ